MFLIKSSSAGARPEINKFNYINLLLVVLTDEVLYNNNFKILKEISKY